MADLSQAAQDIKDAAIDAYWLFHPAQVAAILRAAAAHLGSCNASTELIIIATELENHQ
jgi:hypothetical protein